MSEYTERLNAQRETVRELTHERCVMESAAIDGIRAAFNRADALHILREYAAAAFFEQVAREELRLIEREQEREYSRDLSDLDALLSAVL